MDEKYEFPQAGIHKYVVEYIESLPDLTGKIVVDIPCGDGRASFSFKKRGATIKALDLYPEFIKGEGVEPIFADLSERLPLGDSCALRTTRRCCQPRLASARINNSVCRSPPL